MNAAIVSGINGGVSIQQVASGSHSSLLLSSIDFSLTEIKTNLHASSFQGKYLTQLTGKDDEELCMQKSNQILNSCSNSTDAKELCISRNQTKRTQQQHCDQHEEMSPLVGRHASSFQGKHFSQLTGKDDVISGNQTKTKQQHIDQHKETSPLVHLSIVNGNKEEDSIPVPKVQLYTGKIHAEWLHKYSIGAGLQNLGNTCFMNTVIQCLTYCPPLANYLLQDNDHSSKCNVAGFCMMCLLRNHMKRTIGKTGEVIKPLDVFHFLKSIVKHFQYGRQEDAHEFLRYVIDHLWKSCLSQANGMAKLDSASKETTVINKIFGGYHRSQVICLRCKKESNTFDHFMDFILDIKQNVVTLETALAKFTQPELLQHENCYKCPKCKMKVEAQKRFSIYRAPMVATFQLKRFDYNRSFGGKITKQITYPEKLNLRPYMSDTKGEPVWYRLNAVLVHSGPTCNSGHYYCYVRNAQNLWYVMDDQRVQKVSINQVLNQSAYVLFYIRMENSELTTLKKCLDAKSSFMKGTVTNSHFSRVTETSHSKSVSLGEKNSLFSGLKVYGSPSRRPASISSQSREKNLSSSMQQQVNGCPSVKSQPLQPLSSTPHSGLVPYVEDSSESSSVSSEGSPSRRRHATINVKHPTTKYNSISSGSSWSSPCLEVKTKLSKSVFDTPTVSSPKVSATGAWIVTDAPQTVVSSSASRVTSTTDWRVTEASEDVKNPTRLDSGSPSSSSAQKCNFRKEVYNQGQTTSDHSSTKRKYSSSNHSNDSPQLESRTKKSKYSETVPFLDRENENSCVASSSLPNRQKQYCDKNPLENPFLVNGFRDKSSPVLNGSLEKERRVNGFPKEERQQSFTFTDSQHRKEKMTISDSGKKSTLYGTEIPTWKGKASDSRPSLTSGYEKRRTFDDYDHNIDQGRVRKSKVKDRYFHHKNHFQKHAERQYNSKPYNHHRKHDYRWKHNGHYQRYRNHHRHHY